MATQYPLGRVKLNLNNLETGTDKKKLMTRPSVSHGTTVCVATDGQVVDFEGMQSPIGATMVSTPVVAFVEEPKPF